VSEYAINQQTYQLSYFAYQLSQDISVSTVTILCAGLGLDSRQGQILLPYPDRLWVHQASYPMGAGSSISKDKAAAAFGSLIASM
jgi:hypothetical protein